MDRGREEPDLFELAMLTLVGERLAGPRESADQR